MHTQKGACVSLGMVLRLYHFYKEKGGKGWVLGEKFTMLFSGMLLLVQFILHQILQILEESVIVFGGSRYLPASQSAYYIRSSIQSSPLLTQDTRPKLLRKCWPMAVVAKCGL